MSATKSPAAQRINFGKVELLAETPDLLGIQIQSIKDFFQFQEHKVPYSKSKGAPGLNREPDSDYSRLSFR